MKFEWDEEKNIINKKKHNISFETAAHVFDDPECIEMYDFEHSTNEDRYIALGVVGDVLFVVYTESEYSNAIVHAFQKFRAPFSGKIVHIFPEQSAVI